MTQFPTARALRNGLFIVHSRREVLKLHLHLSLGKSILIDVEQVHVSWADALALHDGAVGMEAAVVARAAEALAVAGHVDEAAGVGADDIPGGDDIFAVLLEPLE